VSSVADIPENQGLALDTNLIVRVLVADEPNQFEAALEVLRHPRLWVSKTVLLETEWVLRYSYRLAREQVQNALRKFLGLPNVHLEDRLTVTRALTAHATGADFADALHLYSSPPQHRFATFDRGLARRAGGDEVDVLLVG
jgi:predicted nucleic-acid-binding protein